MFREHGCELPCKRHVRAHEYAISISHPVHVLSSELRKPIEKSVCLAILFAPSLILRVGGKQWDIAAAKRCPPNLPALSRRRNWKLVLIVPAEDELARKTSQPLGHVGRTSGSPSFATMAVRPRTRGWPKPKVEEENLCKTEVSCGPRVCAVPMFGNLDGERQELMASGNIEGW